MIDQNLLNKILDGFAMSADGIHGLSHWRRVCENGLRVAERSGANPRVVRLFAFLHDAKRRNDQRDPGHGARAAAFVETLRGKYIDLDDDELDHLVYACTYHTDGLVQAHVTVQTCWDADRLDLGRVGIVPAPQYLCTEAARQPEMIEWAYCQSRIDHKETRENDA